MKNSLFGFMCLAALFSSPVCQAEMTSANFLLDSDPVGVAGNWIVSENFHLYGLTAMPPSLTEDQTTTPSGFALQTGVGTSLGYLSPALVEGAVPVDLALGWNLIGNGSNIPINVDVAFNDSSLVTTVWKWNPNDMKWSFYTPSLTGQALVEYVAGKGYNILAAINAGEGFWVNAAKPLTLTLPGGARVVAADFKPSGNLAMITGWNMITLGENRSAADFNLSQSDSPPSMGTIPANLTTLWAWDNAMSKWYFYAPSLDDNNSLLTYVNQKGYLDFAGSAKILGFGVGFWVNKP